MRVLIAGDSQSAGAPGRLLEQGLSALGAQVRRIGHVGHGAYDWTRMHWDEYQAALRDVQPDHVILIFGSNDPPDERLERAMRQFQQSAPSVWYAGPPRYDSRPELQNRSAGIRSLAARVFGDRHLDAWPYTGPSVSRARDGAHFTVSGGETWAQGILREWRNALAGGGVWVGPVILGGAAVTLFGLWWWWNR